MFQKLGLNRIKKNVVIFSIMNFFILLLIGYGIIYQDFKRNAEIDNNKKEIIVFNPDEDCERVLPYALDIFNYHMNTRTYPASIKGESDYLGVCLNKLLPKLTDKFESNFSKHSNKIFENAFSDNLARTIPFSQITQVSSIHDKSYVFGDQIIFNHKYLKISFLNPVYPSEYTFHDSYERSVERNAYVIFKTIEDVEKFKSLLISKIPFTKENNQNDIKIPNLECLGA